MGPGRASRAAGEGGACSESESPQGAAQVSCAGAARGRMYFMVVYSGLLGPVYLALCFI